MLKKHDICDKNKNTTVAQCYCGIKMNIFVLCNII